MPSPSYDVVVIGAGLSGLQAAIDLQQAGKQVLILEARDRVGGKLRSVQRADGRGVQELGATWVNDSNQSTVWSYCERLGLTPVVQNVEGQVACEDEHGSCHFFPFGGLPKFGEKDVQNIAMLRDAVEAASLDPASFTQPLRRHLDDLTFEQYCRSLGAGERALLTARTWTRGTLGHDPSDISALALLEIARGGLGIVNLRYDGQHGAQYLRLREGTSAIAVGMAKLLLEGTIKLSTAVSMVSKEYGLYKVKTQQGEVYAAKQVIVSVPSTAYKDITFDPPLPAWKRSQVSSTRYGTYVKYICLFKTPWWRQQGACGLVQSFKGPINHCRDTSVDLDENYALTCFVASGPARRWLALSDEDRQKAVLEQLSRLFHVDAELVEGQFQGKMESEWHMDQYAGWGCPFPVSPPGSVSGQREDGEMIKEPVGGLIFVGTELTTGNEWRGYMEGALRSGKRGAEQALSM